MSSNDSLMITDAPPQRYWRESIHPRSTIRNYSIRNPDAQHQFLNFFLRPWLANSISQGFGMNIKQVIKKQQRDTGCPHFFKKVEILAKIGDFLLNPWGVLQ